MVPEAFGGNAALTVRRTFPASRERVFQAWTEREALRKWFISPEETSVTVGKLEVRAGGSFRFDFGDGNSSVTGTYLEVVRPEKLVFTWSSAAATDGNQTLVTVRFVECGAETEVVLTHERLVGGEMRSLHLVGWRSLLERLAEALEPMRIT